MYVADPCPLCTVSALMDLNDIRGGRLDVISEESEQQDFSRESSTMEAYTVVPEPGGRTFQRFSVNTNESLRFEPCEDSCPSPTGAEDGRDDVFEKGECEVRGTNTTTACHLLIHS